MIYEGKHVYTQETFDIRTAKIGDYVEQAIVDDFMDILPPACMTSKCAQVGEPITERYDENKGKYRMTYTTFSRVSYGAESVWKYCGDCFIGETTQRGKKPSYIGS
ncbi:MAG: hypothetical protein HFE49_00605 [Clostridia bacterium]|nr:hypothetical protein [Clostridia bacterium]